MASALSIEERIEFILNDKIGGIIPNIRTGEAIVKIYKALKVRLGVKVVPVYTAYGIS